MRDTTSNKYELGYTDTLVTQFRGEGGYLIGIRNYLAVKNSTLSFPSLGFPTTVEIRIFPRSGGKAGTTVMLLAENTSSPTSLLSHHLLL